MSLLEVKDIYKKFGNTEVLKGISFSLEQGEVLSIIGSSGSGKTTLLRCLNFLELADKGNISVFDEEIFCAERKYADKQLRKNRLHFGLVFQSFNLFPQYTAKKNVVLPLNLRTKEQFNQERKQNKQLTRTDLKERLLRNEERSEEFLKEVGLADKMNNYPCELSGGQCQRVAIARALALQPSILCFDEPTSALDPELTGEVLRVIRSLKNPTRSMIIVTHEMSFARDVSDKVIFMADGVIEEMGTPEEIFNAPKSAKLQAFLHSYAENG